MHRESLQYSENERNHNLHRIFPGGDRSRDREEKRRGIQARKRCSANLRGRPVPRIRQSGSRSAGCGRNELPVSGRPRLALCTTDETRGTEISYACFRKGQKPTVTTRRFGAIKKENALSERSLLD